MRFFEITDSEAVSKRIMIISGIVCAIPFVFEKLFFLSWIMYIPVFLLFAGEMNIKKASGRIFLFGYAYFVTGYSWLCELYPLDFAGFTKPAGMLVIVIALTAVPALHSALLTAAFAACKWASAKLPCLVNVFLFPCVFVLSELLQSVGPFAFPWCRVSISQYGCLAMVQSVCLFGAYFITYIVLLANALFALALTCKEKRKKLRLAAFGCAIIALNIAFGGLRLAVLDDELEKSDVFTGIALQGNVPSGVKWSLSNKETAERYLGLAKEAIELADAKGYSGERIILMPETGFPFTLREGGKYANAVSEFAKDNKVNFAVGAFADTENGSGNALFIFSPEGEMSEPYLKQHLVPFGEFLPYRSFFETFVPVLADINILAEDIASGKENVIFDTGAGKIGTLICYESIFPEQCRESVNNGAQIILVSTNDSWFGSSGALRHHLAAASLRAIENGVPVIRAANTGISALIRPDGKIQAELGADKTGFVTAELPYGTGRTLYSIIGDLLMYMCIAFFSVCLLLNRKRH